MKTNQRAVCFFSIVLLTGISAVAQATESSSVPVMGIAVDYPVRALREGRAGTVFFTVVVGPEGRPKSCAVTTSSGHADLDHAACTRVMRTARFAPAANSADSPPDRSFSSKAEFKISE